MPESAYEQKEPNMAVSEPISNPYNDMVLIAKEYSAAYRALCRLRIEIASLYEEKAWSKVDWVPHKECKKNAEFWARSGAYWKKKLEVRKTPLDAIHAMLAVKDIHKKMEKAIGNITASRVARTRPIKSKYRLLTDWQTEILEIMEANGVPEENIGKVLDLL